MKVNSTSYLLSDLQHGKNYQIYVVAVNVHGSSLPSSIIEVDISEGNCSTAIFSILKTKKLFKNFRSWQENVRNAINAAFVSCYQP